ncbi:SAP domain-containing ribonucleoprotein isoform X2 [Macrosteles quadrilineatus]|uniref:SAP domain-containing ribonucleoprotein isoform X2 n=1 Tax=Macrosteles quadrilineatus TaxID=74068 RepID=UPI0023E2070A|nr:SAP domain-containing ribonucleoprotein isoform X2 [Macrosteles quadrilineatus]
MSTSETDLSSISKMKVAELKKELKARGLSTAGAKNELQERLQQAIQGSSQDLGSEDGNAESEILDEDDVLGDEEEGGEFDDDEADAVLADEPKTEVTAKVPAAVTLKRPAPLATEPSQEVQPKKRVLVRPMAFGKENGEEEKKSTEETKKDSEDKKVIKISGVAVKDRLEMRAQKFGVPLSVEAKKEARAARFGLATTQEKKTQENTNVISTKIGTNKIIKFEIEQQEKLKKRQERFGITSSVPATAVATVAKTTVSTKTHTPITMSDMEAKKKLRAERFKI